MIYIYPQTKSFNYFAQVPMISIHFQIKGQESNVVLSGWFSQTNFVKGSGYVNHKFVYYTQILTINYGALFKISHIYIKKMALEVHIFVR